VLLSTALVAAAAPAFTFRAGDNLSYDAPEGRIERTCMPASMPRRTIDASYSSSSTGGISLR